MAAMKGDDNLAGLEQLRKACEPPAIIRQRKLRHGFANLRRRSSGAGLFQASHHAIHNIGKI